MRRVKPFGGVQRTEMAAVVAGEQWGVIGGRQLHDCGVSAEAIKWWLGTGRLHLKHPGVYAYGHPWLPVEGRMVAAILHAGGGTALSHATVAWWWRIIEREPTVIHVSTTSRARSTDGVVVHHPRHLDATTHRRSRSPRWRGRSWTMRPAPATYGRRSRRRNAGGC